ncbi:class I SAM-dependent methyltransferase [Sorangium sp. So ce887]|uniref:class I SAM-dependent methyltransferase n=1 Tax=Sorangium sp. So ce887 TaxID=3133324 RepID=UPI003F61BD0D
MHSAPGVFVGPHAPSKGLVVRRGDLLHALSTDEAYVLLLALALASSGIAFEALCEALSRRTESTSPGEIARWEPLGIVLTRAPLQPAAAIWGEVRDQARLWDEQYASGSHEQMWETGTSQELIVTYLALGLPVGSRCLDLGCGSGGDLAFLAQRGCAVTGLDISEAALALARRRFEEGGLIGRLVLGDVLHVPLEDESLDFISDRGCFHHVLEGDRPRYAAEVTRLLRPGGWFLLRGCRQPGGLWIPILEEELARLFTADDFERRPLLPFTFGGASPVPGAIALMQRR